MFLGSQLIYTWCKFLTLLWTKNKGFKGMTAGPWTAFEPHQSKEDLNMILFNLTY